MIASEEERVEIAFRQLGSGSFRNSSQKCEYTDVSRASG
jgi:hypothetical protein